MWRCRLSLQDAPWVLCSSQRLTLRGKLPPNLCSTVDTPLQDVDCVSAPSSDHSKLFVALAVLLNAFMTSFDEAKRDTYQQRTPPPPPPPPSSCKGNPKPRVLEDTAAG